MRALGTIDGSTDTRPWMMWKKQNKKQTNNKKTPYLDSRANLLTNNSQNCPTLQVVFVCTPCSMLLHAIVYFWKLLPKVRHWSKFWANWTTFNISSVLWSPKRSTTVLDPLLSVQLFQHCWGHACAKHMVSKILWVVSFPRCTAGPKIIGSWCSCLHNTGNVDATTPNIVSPTLLGVVVSVYTWLKCERISTSYITWI